MLRLGLALTPAMTLRLELAWLLRQASLALTLELAMTLGLAQQHRSLASAARYELSGYPVSS